MLSLMFLLMIGGLIGSVYAESVTVIVPPLNDCLHRGYWYSSINGKTVWVGSININISNMVYNAYCIQYDVNLYAGYTYTAPLSAAPDLPIWRSISYILTWYHSSSISNNEGFAIQAAIWKYATGTDPTGACNTDGSLASQIYNAASAKNVVRPGDVLTLTPESGAVPVGTSQLLTAKVVNGSGSPKPGVRIKFSTTLGVFTDTGTDKIEGITDANGEVNVGITSSIQGLAEITASTNGMWAHILDMQRNGNNYQDLIGLGYPEIVVKSDIAFVRFFVIPEVSLGTVTVTLTSLAAIVFMSKVERRRWRGTI